MSMKYLQRSIPVRSETPMKHVTEFQQRGLSSPMSYEFLWWENSFLS